jgi:RNA polymerase sigma factor (sigma-70 family)
MHDVSDMELLRNYDLQGSEDAFAELVRRHINLVYSAALRRVRIAAHAEEITQAVFVILVRKAASLHPDTVLEGWLYETARLTSLSFLRGERRRQRREQEAYMQSTLQESNEVSIWNQLGPLLDEAMSRVGKKDRDAVVLRLFKEKNLGEVAAALKVTEAAAQSRVHRAVERLHGYFKKRGVTLTTAIITGTISAHSVQAAPVALAKTVTAVAITKGAAASGSVLILVKGTMKTMTWLSMKWLNTTIVAAILANAVVSKDIVATHFDWAGHPNAWMTHSHYVLVSLLFGCGYPLFFVAIGYLVRFVPVTKYTFKIANRDYWLAPERREETFKYFFHHCLWMACFAAIFVLALQLLVVQANHQAPPKLSSPLAWGAGGCFIVVTAIWIGILMRHFKRIPVGP